MGYLEYLNEALEAYGKALEEYKRALKERDITLLRNACDKGWLAVVKATDALLVRKGIEPAKSHIDRRDKLWKLSKEDEGVRRLGFYDRLGARMLHLHIQGYYDGSVTFESVKVELEKVKEYINDVQAIYPLSSVCFNGVISSL